MPRLDDDLTTVTLDLHGALVHQATVVLRRTVRLAAERGRSQVRVIHGASTSDPDGRNPTIKHALDQMLDSGDLSEVTAALASGGATTLGLPLGGRRDTRRITLADVW